VLANIPKPIMSARLRYPADFTLGFGGMEITVAGEVCMVGGILLACPDRYGKNSGENSQIP
jgi:hypothetical protein